MLWTLAALSLRLFLTPWLLLMTAVAHGAVCGTLRRSPNSTSSAKGRAANSVADSKSADSSRFAPYGHAVVARTRKSYTSPWPTRTLLQPSARDRIKFRRSSPRDFPNRNFPAMKRIPWRKIKTEHDFSPPAPQPIPWRYSIPRNLRWPSSLSTTPSPRSASFPPSGTRWPLPSPATICLIATGKGLGTVPNEIRSNPRNRQSTKKIILILPRCFTAPSRAQSAGSGKESAGLYAHRAGTNAVARGSNRASLSRGRQSPSSRDLHHQGKSHLRSDFWRSESLVTEILRSLFTARTSLRISTNWRCSLACSIIFMIPAKFPATGTCGQPRPSAATTTKKPGKSRYRSGERTYDFEGMVADESPLDHDEPDVNEPVTGYLWGNVARHGLSYRHYGEFVASEWCER